MDRSKQAKFVNRMGKKKLKLKREYFDGGGIAGLLGSAGGLGGTGFTANSGTNASQINNAYNANQGALFGQQILSNQLATPIPQAINAQNTLSQQYAQQAAGQGPNVATNELNQATGANVANQAALMAGQRGASSNPALLAREAAQQGASTQQQAAGQAATTQAQQQIAAEQAQAQLAGNQIAQAQGATNANTGAQQAEQGILQGANTANNNITGQLANTSMQGQQGLLGGVMNGVGALTGLAHGGEVHPDKKHKAEFVHKMIKMGLQHFDEGTSNGTVGDNSTTATGSLAQTAANFFSKPPSQAEAAPTQDQKYEAIRKQNAANVGRADGGMIQSYADGGLTVPSIQVQQAAQNPFMVPQAVQGGFTAGPNAGAAAMGSSMKAAPKQAAKTPPAASTPPPPNPAVSPVNKTNPGGFAPGEGMMSNVQDPVFGGQMGAAPQLVVPVQASNSGDYQGAAHGGEMHQHFTNHFKNHFAKGGPVPAMVSPGEVYLSPEKVHQVIHGDIDPIKIGEKFKGKAKVKGDSLKNDTIPKTLEEGGIVIDREHMGSPEKRKLFVHRAIAKKKAGAR